MERTVSETPYSNIVHLHILSGGEGGRKEDIVNKVAMPSCVTDHLNWAPKTIIIRTSLVSGSGRFVNCVTEMPAVVAIAAPATPTLTAATTDKICAVDRVNTLASFVFLRYFAFPLIWPSSDEYMQQTPLRHTSDERLCKIQSLLPPPSFIISSTSVNGYTDQGKSKLQHNRGKYRCIVVEKKLAHLEIHFQLKQILSRL